MSALEWKKLADRSLVWSRPKLFQRRYELHAGRTRIGTLKFEKLLGSLATSNLGDKEWTLKREGFWRPHVNVRSPGSEMNLAVFRPGWTGSGTVEFPDGSTLEWESVNFWGTDWAFRSTVKRPLVTMRFQGAFKKTARVEIDRTRAEEPVVPLLVVLGWYLLVLRSEENAAH